MSETVARQRPSVDLDDFARHLQPHAQRAQPSYSHEDDPLAELARIVGDQPDPYGDVFARQPAVASQHEDLLRPSHDPHGRHVRQEPSLGALPPRFAADFAAIEAGLRGAMAAPQPAAPHSGSPQMPALYAAEHHGDRHGDYGYEPEAQYGLEPQNGAAHQNWSEPARPARAGSRRPVYAMAASIAVAVVGIGVAFAYKGTGSSPREIKTIMAAAGPTKEQPPADQAAATDADANTAQQPSTKLVSREEQPVDLAQAVQDNAAARGTPDATDVPVPASPGQAAGTMSPDYSNMGGAAPDTASAGSASPAYGGDQAGFGVGMPQPKRVKSVSVTPDGRIVNAAASEASPGDAPAPEPAAKSSDRAGPVTGSPLFPTQLPKSSNRATKPTTPHRVAAAPPADDGADEAAAPKPAKAAKKAKPPVKVASVETGASDATDTAAADEAKPEGSGGFAVQLAAPGSEADARSTTSRLLKQYSAALHGRRLGFHRADSNGRTVYRVRVSSLSKDDATSLCSKLKAGGGSCFVAKN